MEKTLIAAFYDNTLHLSVTKSKKSKAHKTFNINNIDIDIDPGEIQNHILDFLREHSYKPNEAVIILKSSKIISRVKQVHNLSKNERKQYIALNADSFFPFDTTGFFTDISVLCALNHTVFFATAIPECYANTLIGLFKDINIRVTKIIGFADFIINNHNETQKNAVIVDNFKKTVIILFEESSPVIIRDIPFYEDSFANDFSGILKDYGFSDISKVHYFGEKSWRFLPKHDGKTAINEISVDSLLNPSINNCINMLPPPYKTKLAVYAAIKRSAAVLLALILVSVFITTALIFANDYYRAKNNNEGFSAKNEDININIILQEIMELENIDDNLSAPDHFYDTLIPLFSIVPIDIKIISVTVQYESNTASLTGVSKTDSALIAFIDNLAAAYTEASLETIGFDEDEYPFLILIKGI